MLCHATLTGSDWHCDHVLSTCFPARPCTRAAPHGSSYDCDYACSDPCPCLCHATDCDRAVCPYLCLRLACRAPGCHCAYAPCSYFYSYPCCLTCLPVYRPCLQRCPQSLMPVALAAHASLRHAHAIAVARWLSHLAGQDAWRALVVVGAVAVQWLSCRLRGVCLPVACLLGLSHDGPL